MWSVFFFEHAGYGMCSQVAQKIGGVPNRSSNQRLELVLTCISGFVKVLCGISIREAQVLSNIHNRI